MTKKTLRIVLAAGGTGGHIFPAEALANGLDKSGHKVWLLADSRYHNYKSTLADDHVKTIISSSLSGNIVKKAKAALCIPLGILQAIIVLKRIKPDVVVGFGGYPSFPTMLAACLLHYPTIIHEQNSVLGKVNAFLAHYVHRIATSFDEVKGIADIDQKKIVKTGNPVRPSVMSVSNDTYTLPDESTKFNLLVIGGSQGSTIFSDVIPKAIAAMPPELRGKLRITQQVRKEDIDNAWKCYSKASVHANLAPFFDNMPALYCTSHLVLARAGASTLSELVLVKRPAVLVPYKYATDNHQYYNAKILADAGGVYLLEQDAFTVEQVAALLTSYVSNPQLLVQMSQALRGLAVTDAVERLIAEVEQVGR